MICVPLTFRQKPVGVLKVYSEKPHHFTAREIKVLQITAGLLSAAIAQTRDAEEKKRAHLALQDNERKFRTLFEASNDTIMISKDGVILEVNEAFTKLFGYTHKEIYGQKLDRLVLPSELPRVHSNYYSDVGYAYELTCIRKDGSKFFAEGLGKTIEHAGEKIRMSTLRDITDQKEMLKVLRHSEAKAREATQAKSEFLANMSHEIRTPLNGVLGIANLLADTQLDLDQQQYLEMMRRSAESLLTIVNDILDFSKIEAKKLTLENVGFDLKAAVEDVRQILNYTASKKGLNFSCHYDENLPLYIQGDPSRLRQVILNLAANAIKFSDKGSVTIHVSVRELKQDSVNLRFEVKDTGIGIPASAMGSMFQAFSQVNASNNRKFGGTGLGLSISRQLVELMKGEIGVESKEGQGSTFWFTLPAMLAQNTLTLVNKNLGLESAGNRKLRVLIAEDNTVNQIIAKAMMQKAGHSFTIVANGQEALDALKIAPYDVILMDCQMPEMDGFEATKIIRRSTHENWSQIPIIAVTANAMAGDKERCLAVGMTDYVSKPLRAEELLQALQKMSA